MHRIGDNIHQYLADLFGAGYTVVEKRSFKFSWRKAREAVDASTPPVLGPLDMFYLHYYEGLYRQRHIPIHYVLLVGHDDENAYVLDTDQDDVQAVPLAELRPAWDVNVPGLGKPNRLVVFDIPQDLPPTDALIRKSIADQCQTMLEPPVSMFGIKGMRKLKRELPQWPAELDAKQLDICLRHLAEFTGVPPVPPNRLTGYDAPDDHTDGRIIFAGLLRKLAADYAMPAWAEAAAVFEQSGQALVELTDAVVDYLLGESDTLVPASELITEIAALEECAFRAFRDA